MMSSFGEDYYYMMFATWSRARPCMSVRITHHRVSLYIVNDSRKAALRPFMNAGLVTTVTYNIHSVAAQHMLHAALSDYCARPSGAHKLSVC